MPHNPEAGSASQKEAIEEPIDPPFSGRLIAAFFRSKQRDKKKKFFYKNQKIKKEKNYKRTKKLLIYQKFFNSFIFISSLIFFFFLSSLLLDHLKISHRPRVRSKVTGPRAIFCLTDAVPRPKSPTTRPDYFSCCAWFVVRSYHDEHTTSHPNCEVKHR